MGKLVCKRYVPSMSDEWNRVVEKSRNGTFLINRQYLDYHSDRFADHSLVFENDGEIVALLPANEVGDTLYSHQGLTYGGVIMSVSCGAVMVLEIFDLLVEYMRDNGFKKLEYKPIPHIYHKRPSEEDLYALSRLGAKVAVCSVSSTINLVEEVEFASMRRRGVKRAEKRGVEVFEESDLARFWDILTTNLLERHSVKPVHTIDEIKLLQSRFPNQIKLFVAKKNEDVLAGVLMYETDVCVHSQYIAATPQGRDTGALDLIFDYLINKRYNGVRYFDFGISTENGGKVLNQGLISQKEGFGATATIYQTLSLTL